MPKELHTDSVRLYTTRQGIAAMLIVICYLVVIVNVRFVYVSACPFCGVTRQVCMLVVM